MARTRRRNTRRSEPFSRSTVFWPTSRCRRRIAGGFFVRLKSLWIGSKRRLRGQRCGSGPRCRRRSLPPAHSLPLLAPVLLVLFLPFVQARQKILLLLTQRILRKVALLRRLLLLHLFHFPHDRVHLGRLPSVIQDRHGGHAEPLADRGIGSVGCPHHLHHPPYFFGVQVPSAVLSTPLHRLS